jgi:phytoene dehydrogenase-like protein
MQAIPDALAQALLAAGGQIRTAAQVKRIIVESEVVRGVELADGSVVEADVVIAAVPPQVTATMLDPTTSGVAGLRRAPANAAGFGCLTIGVALTGKADLSTHQPARNDGVDLRKPTLFFGTLEQILTAERETRSGRIPSDPPWTATILSATDPTQAPIGQDIVYLYAPTPVRPTSGWSIAREGAVEALVQSVGKYVSGLEERRIGMFAETPADLESRLGAPNGCIYHVDHVLTRLGPLRPAHGWGGNQSPIAGLVLSGAGTHPGGGVSGIPGQLAARAVLAGGQRRG